jgi:hypothetical protein
VIFSDPDGISTWKAEVLDGKSKVRNFPDIEYAEKMKGDVNPGYTTQNDNLEKKKKKALTMNIGFG